MEGLYKDMLIDRNPLKYNQDLLNFYGKEAIKSFGGDVEVRGVLWGQHGGQVVSWGQHGNQVLWGQCGSQVVLLGGGGGGGGAYN